MDLETLEKMAEKEKILVTNGQMQNVKARIIECYGYNIIMDYSKISTYTEEKCLLAEELGHYYYSSLYTFNSSQTEIEQNEYKAMKWKSLTCVPIQAIIDCFKKGICNYWEIAEELQVEPQMVQFAYKYYVDNRLLNTDQQVY